MNSRTSQDENRSPCAQLLARLQNTFSSQELEELLAQSGAFQRKPRKLTATLFIRGLLASVFESKPTLEGMAGTFSLLCRGRYTKQAVHKRINAGALAFVVCLLRHLFEQTALRQLPAGIFAPFARVLVQDSTSITLPKRYEPLYPGSDNQHGSNSVMKFQLILEMISGRIADLSISSYRRNDQAATADIFSVAQRGDLVLRDLGYFCYESFKRMIEHNIFFISRLCGQIPVLDSQSRQPIELSRQLERAGGVFDRMVLIGKKQQIPVRLVAVPVPEQVAAQRRRKATQGKDKRLSPSKERLRLMNWNILITNVPNDLLNSQQILKAYYFRWRIEIIFKAWKSMLALEHLNFHCERMLHLSLTLKLLLCVLTHATAFNLELATAGNPEHVSILRVARIIRDSLPLLLTHFLGLTPQQLLEFRLRRHSFYDRHKSRKNFFESLYDPTVPLPLATLG
jgi:hypothetical protein